MNSYDNQELLGRIWHLGVLAVVCTFAVLSSACESEGGSDDGRITNAGRADAEADSTGPDTTSGPDALVAGWADCTAGEYAGAFFNGQGGYKATVTQTNAGCEMIVRWTLEMSGYETRRCVNPPNDGSAAPDYNVGSGLDLGLDAICKIIRVEQAPRFFDLEGDETTECGRLLEGFDENDLVVDLIAAKTNRATFNDGINAIGCCAESRVSFRLGEDSDVGYDVTSERQTGEDAGCNQTVEYFNGGESPERVVECRFDYLSHASARPGTAEFAESFDTLPRYEELAECELVEE